MKSSYFLTTAAVAAAVFTAGCAESTMTNKLQMGMTKDQVIGLMGRPDSTSAQANVEYLTYYLVVNDGYGRDQPYMVRLVDGKVESFGRFLPLYDLYNRPVTAARAGTSDFPMGASLNGTTVVRVGDQGRGHSDLASQLQQLKQLHDSGVLTDEEFAKAKAKLLGS